MSSLTAADAFSSNMHSASSPGENNAGAKRKRSADYDDDRRKEIRETNRIAARECRARKKNLMVELEKTVANLTAEHSALSKHNREMTIRLETLERTAAVGLGPAMSGGNPSLMGGMGGMAQMAGLGAMHGGMANGAAGGFGGLNPFAALAGSNFAGANLAALSAGGGATAGLQ